MLFFLSTDTGTIEIRSDEEEGSGATKTRRTYNYRVSNVTYCIGRSVTYFNVGNYLVLMVERKDPGNEEENPSFCLPNNYITYTDLAP